MKPNPKRILIVEPTRLLSECIAQNISQLFGKETHVQMTHRKSGIIGELERNIPEIILLGCQTRANDDKDFITQIVQSFKEIKIIVLCEKITRTNYQRLMKSGVTAVVGYQNSIEDLMNVIKEVWNNKSIEVFNFDKEPDNSNLNSIKFTANEFKILKLIRLQMTTNQIAAELGVHTKTIEYHKARMMEKTNSSKMVGVIEYVIINNLL